VTRSVAQAMLLRGPGSLERVELRIPEPGRDDGILKIEACGLCGTDHEQYSGHLSAPYAFIPGHEIVGVVEQAGPVALERWGVAVGDRVAVEVFLSCRECPQCQRGAYRRCQRHGLGDMYGFVDVDKPPGLWGGYATHLYLAPDALMLRVPSTLGPVEATLFNPLGAGVRWAVQVPGTGHGDIVVILGPGIRGLAACAAAKQAGASFVMVTGLGPRDAKRLAVAPRFGADLTVDVASQDPVSVLREVTGRLADTVIDVTAKAPTAPGQALRLVRPEGTVVLAGTRGGLSDWPGFDPDLIVYKEVRLLGALGVDAPAYQVALEMLASGDFAHEALDRTVTSFDGLEGLLRTMAGGSTELPPIHAVFVPDA
jgi:alcohol dehydrogenase